MSYGVGELPVGDIDIIGFIIVELEVFLVLIVGSGIVFDGMVDGDVRIRRLSVGYCRGERTGNGIAADVINVVGYEQVSSTNVQIIVF